MDLQLSNFIPNLKCPVSGQELKILSSNELARLNEAVKAGKIYANDGEQLLLPLSEALVTVDGQYVYPVIDEKIAALLPSNAISTQQLQGNFKPETKISALDKDKKVVQQFYDDYGWHKTDEGYNDTLTFEDRRAVSEKYWSKCHLRLNKYLPGGKYLLDVASGSIPNDEYLTFCGRYEARICVDFSIQALKEAATRLNNKGIYILGDMTALPFKEDCIDAVISMHTVYHVPQKEQTKAVSEVYRVLKPGGQGAIVYSWNRPPLMRFAFSLWRPMLKIYRKLKGRSVVQKKRSDMVEKQQSRPDLFVQQQDYRWFKKYVKKAYNARLLVYSAISRSFSNTFIQEKAFGRQISSFIFWLENKFPALMGRLGQYPVFLIQKEKRSLRPASARDEKRPRGKQLKQVGV